MMRFQLVALVALGGTLGAIGLHYVVFGPHRLPKAQGKVVRVRRFSVAERIIHLTTMLSFLTLAVTGMAASIGSGTRLTGLLWVYHAYAAPVFLAGLTGLVIIWAQDGRFAVYDLKWFLYFGGYLGFGRHKGLRAGRFNAGQKVLFWIVAVFGLTVAVSGAARMFPVLGEPADTWMYWVHQYSALVLVLTIVAHAYLGTLANPGTIQVAFTGRVSADWAQEHHSVWWEEVNRPGT